MGELKMRTNVDLVLLHQRFGDAAAAIDALAQLAKKQGLVSDLYIEKLQEREREYPTGLEMPIPLAIPHIADGCNQSFVAIATMAEPVVFQSMDRSGDEIKAEIVFLFGIVDPKSQLAVLRKFAAAFSNKAAVERLLLANTEAELLEHLDLTLEGLLSIG